jgi:hypothetical protein
MGDACRVCLLRCSKEISGWLANIDIIASLAAHGNFDHAGTRTGFLRWLTRMATRCFICGLGARSADAQGRMPSRCMVCALSLHVVHAPLTRTNFLWHVCVLSQPRPDLRSSGMVLVHRYLAGGIWLITTVQHELLLTSHGGWDYVFCWPMAVRVCERRATLRFKAPQPTRTMHCESSVKTSSGTSKLAS